MKRRKLLISICAAPISLFALFLILNLLFPLPTFNFDKYPSVSIHSQEGKLMRVFISLDGRYRARAKLDEVNPFLIQAIISYEDKYFYYHPGVNPFSLARAFITNIKAKKVICGGSTITMQIARMIEPKKRNILSKLIEVFRSLQLEWGFSKKELLEIYFNLAPYGGNIEGVKTASYFYFGKPPSQLSKGEVCLLIALPRNPEKVRPDRYLKNAYKMRKRVAERLVLQGSISRKDYDEIMSEPIPQQRRDLPFIAPHLAQLVRSKYPQEDTIITTINFNLQTALEKKVREYVLPLKKQGITQACAVVIENKTHKVKALVGSVDFFDKHTCGQVNGVIARRSPGSTLKPILYALALDEGMITPQMVLPDVPIDYSGYSPTNYNGEHRGPVTAEEALLQSLNTVAVTLYAKTRDKFFNLLKDGGINTLKNPFSHYGLALILGSCEVTLLDLTSLYSGIANLGIFSNYRLIEDKNPTREKKLLSSTSCYIISEMLAKGERVDLPIFWEATLDMPKIAWKTGTSYGRRDAWAIGYNPDYTVGVWVGNFSGEGHERLVGGKVATPLLFDIFDNYLPSKRWFKKPQDIEMVDVCALSGLLKDKDCPVSKKDFYIPGVSPNKRCGFHKRVLIDEETGCILCPLCKQDRVYREVLFVQYPPKIATYLKRGGYPVDEIPRHYPTCTALFENKAPLIRSPSQNGIYYISNEIDKRYQRILFEASVPNSIRKIHWFIDGKIFSSVTPTEKVFYTPEHGKHKIVCMDDTGNSSEVLINVIDKSQM